MSKENKVSEDIKGKLTVVNAENYSTDDYITPNQSANTLFHFMRKYDWLCDTLKTSKICPRYYEERFDFLDRSLPSLAFPMKCFCDIYLEKLHFHISTYGAYGLGFSKEWLISQNVQPVQYINPHSEIGVVLRNEFIRYVEKYGDNIPKDKFYDMVFRQLRYIKPLYGNMRRDDIEDRHNFHDEREWRFIPDIPIEDAFVDLVWNGAYCNLKKIQQGSEELSKNEHYVIPFTSNELKYIIVPTEKDSEKIRHFIFDELQINEIEKLALISKILVYDVSKEDW